VVPGPHKLGLFAKLQKNIGVNNRSVKALKRIKFSAKFSLYLIGVNNENEPDDETSPKKIVI
jgi:hypothetical protein